MTERSTYNGWTNYATWRVQLEIFNTLDLEDWNLASMDVYDLADWMKEYTEETIEGLSSEGLARDYALAFLSDVNWNELAQHARDDYAAALDDETENEDA